jgi:hypothetical protein
LLPILACGSDGDDGMTFAEEGEGESGDTDQGESQTGEDDAEGDDDQGDDGGNDDGSLPVLDVGFGDVGGGDPPPQCKVGDELDPPAACDQATPEGPDNFEPEVQWEFEGEDLFTQAVAVPAVINLTDDNDDGEIDLCDIPDIVVPLYPTSGDKINGSLFVLDGETGQPHFSIEQSIHPLTHPAVGDIDNDGLPEIVTSGGPYQQGQVMAFEHDGTPKWTSAAIQPWLSGAAPMLADLDNDGDVEIVVSGQVYDHDGNLLWADDTGTGSISASTAADLDGDGDLEVITGWHAYHHDGSSYFSVNGNSYPFPQVANLDDDDEPEVLLVTIDGLTVLEHDGTVKHLYKKPIFANSWLRPPAIHDMDGDGDPEIAAASVVAYGVFETNLQGANWTYPIQDGGFASGTAFDFLGQGKAQAMYADEYELFIFDDDGTPLLTWPRSSWTQIENPVVADVDNDGAAEIVVTSNKGYMGQSAPTVQLVRDVNDAWIPARRIWNQHTYHVTNVLEDGRIPQFEQPSWEYLNTFRTQAQIAPGGVCVPEG